MHYMEMKILYKKYVPQAKIKLCNKMRRRQDLSNKMHRSLDFFDWILVSSLSY